MVSQHTSAQGRAGRAGEWRTINLAGARDRKRGNLSSKALGLTAALSGHRMATRPRCLESRADSRAPAAARPALCQEPRQRRTSPRRHVAAAATQWATASAACTDQQVEPLLRVVDPPLAGLWEALTNKSSPRRRRSRDVRPHSTHHASRSRPHHPPRSRRLSAVAIADEFMYFEGRRRTRAGRRPAGGAAVSTVGCGRSPVAPGSSSWTL